MDVRFINPFVAAIANVFKTMVNIDVKVSKPMLKSSAILSADVSGVIGLSGDIQGCVVLSFPEAVACKVASAFAGVEMTMQHPDFADAIGELANMVAGNAKKDFQGVSANISLPSVITGAGHTVSQSRVAPFLVIPCETSLGPFMVEVAFQQGSNKQTSAAGKPAMAGV